MESVANGGGVVKYFTLFWWFLVSSIRDNGGDRRFYSGCVLCNSLYVERAVLLVRVSSYIRPDRAGVLRRLAEKPGNAVFAAQPFRGRAGFHDGGGVLGNTITAVVKISVRYAMFVGCVAVCKIRIR